LLSLYNSLTRNREPFTPIEDMQVKMYTCGPSTYQRAHIGNYRTILYEDVLQRYARAMKQKKLSAEDAKAAMQVLRRVDSVLQVTFWAIPTRLPASLFRRLLLCEARVPVLQ